MTRYRWLTLATMALGAAAAVTQGCDDDDNGGPVVIDASTDAANDAGGGDAMDAGDAADEGAADGDADAADTGVAGDPQVLAIVLVANTGEVQQGQLAEGKAIAVDVRNFAAMMVTDHTAAQQREQHLVQITGIAVQPSATSQLLQAASDAMIAQLQPLTGVTFDRAYITGQIQEHSQVLTLIDSVLLPAASTDLFRTELRTVRAAVVAHLAEAQRIDGLLRADGGSDGGSDGGGP